VAGSAGAVWLGLAEIEGRTIDERWDSGSGGRRGGRDSRGGWKAIAAGATGAGGTQPAGVVAAALLCVIVLAAVFAGVAAMQDPLKQAIPDSLLPPGGVGQRGVLYLLGTDALGRDVYSRIVFGARVSLTIGVAAVCIGTIGGLVPGLVSGYRSGRTDMILQRIMNAIQSIPTLILALMLVSVLGKSLAITAVAIGVTQIPRANRIIRSSVLSLSREPYIEAARATGASELQIILRHLLPNVVPITIVVFSTSIGAAIVVEATLSFLGLAAPPRPGHNRG